MQLSKHDHARISRGRRDGPARHQDRLSSESSRLRSHRTDDVSGCAASRKASLDGGLPWATSLSPARGRNNREASAFASASTREHAEAGAHDIDNLRINESAVSVSRARKWPRGLPVVVWKETCSHSLQARASSLRQGCRLQIQQRASRNRTRPAALRARPSLR